MLRLAVAVQRTVTAGLWCRHRPHLNVAHAVGTRGFANNLPLSDPWKLLDISRSADLEEIKRVRRNFVAAWNQPQSSHRKPSSVDLSLIHI